MKPFFPFPVHASMIISCLAALVRSLVNSTSIASRIFTCNLRSEDRKRSQYLSYIFICAMVCFPRGWALLDDVLSVENSKISQASKQSPANVSNGEVAGNIFLPYTSTVPTSKPSLNILLLTKQGPRSSKNQPLSKSSKNRPSNPGKLRSVIVCHVPVNDPIHFRDISIDQISLQGHLKKYPLDKPGPCKNYCHDLCDDGNKCTVNHQVSNQCLCLSQPQYIDCDDGDPITKDECYPSIGCVHGMELSMSIKTWEVSDSLNLKGVKEDQVDWDVSYTSKKTSVEAKCFIERRSKGRESWDLSANPFKQTPAISNSTSDLDKFLQSCLPDSVQLHVTVPRTTQNICFGAPLNCRQVLCHLGGEILKIGQRDFSSLSYAPGNNQLLFGLNRNCEIIEPYFWNEYVNLVLGNNTRSRWSNDELYRMDFDGDGLPNIVEYYGLRIGDMYADIAHGGHPPHVTPDWPFQFPSTATDPYNVDTDGDLLTDDYELLYGMNPRNFDDILADMDGDGLADYKEQIYRTNPFTNDTDGDGASDLKEVQDATDPLDDSDFLIGGASRSFRLRHLSSSTAIPIALTIGDHSGSHSERYVIRVGIIEHAATDFGVLATETYNFRAGVYPITVRHLDSNLAEPDYDYTAKVEFPTNSDFNVIVDDPDELLGSFLDQDTGLGIDRTVGKVAKLVVKQSNQVCGYETCVECNNDALCRWTFGSCRVDEYPFSSTRNTPEDCSCSKCEVWAGEERKKGLEWINDLPMCPCLVKEVSVDSTILSISLKNFGSYRKGGISWLEPIGSTGIDWSNDLMCNPTVGCPFRNGAYGCLSTRSFEGYHGQECCYDSNLEFIPSGKKSAGTPDYSIEPLEHFVSDVLPFKDCCDACEDPLICNLYIGVDVKAPGVRSDLRGCTNTPVCGDGNCEMKKGESYFVCPEDCVRVPEKCPDDYCDHGETFQNCPEDCKKAPTNFPWPPVLPDDLDRDFLDLVARCAHLSNIVYNKVSSMNDPFVRDNFWIYPPEATDDKTLADAALVSREYESGRCIVALAGTNFKNSLDTWQVANPLVRDVQGCGVREGWAQAFFGTDKSGNPIAGHYGAQLEQRIKDCIRDGLTLVFTGHSQGGALALVGHLAYNDEKQKPLSITFAAPPTFVSALSDFGIDPCPKVENDRIYRFINTEHDELALNYDVVPFIGEAIEQTIPLGIAALAFLVGPEILALDMAVPEIRRRVGTHKGPVAILQPFTADESITRTASVKVYPNQYAVGKPPLWMFDILDMGLDGGFDSAHSTDTYERKIRDLIEFPLKTDGFELGTQCNFHTECSSGKCESPSEKICINLLKDKTYDCEADEDCKSGRCKKSIILYDRCEEKLVDGSDCERNSDCISSCFCHVYTDKTCGPKADLGEYCLSSDECKTGRCSFTCQPLIDDKDTACADDTDCLTGRCFDINWSFNDFCTDKIWDGSVEKCERNAECVDGSFCSDNRCKKKSGLGVSCKDHADCETGRCDYPARKVCVR